MPAEPSVPNLTRVADLMTRRPVSLRPEQTVREAVALFAERRFRHLLVVEGETLVGVLSDRDVLRFLAENPNGAKAAVQSVMTRQPLAVVPSTSLADALGLIIKQRINCLPVVDAAGTVEGILTTTDFTRALYAIQYWLESRAVS